jgi:hypothetical protein
MTYQSTKAARGAFASVANGDYPNNYTIECADFREENRRLARLLVNRGYLTTGDDADMPTNFNDCCSDYLNN